MKRKSHDPNFFDAMKTLQQQANTLGGSLRSQIEALELINTDLTAENARLNAVDQENNDLRSALEKATREGKFCELGLKTALTSLAEKETGFLNYAANTSRNHDEVLVKLLKLRRDCDAKDALLADQCVLINAKNELLASRDQQLADYAKQLSDYEKRLQASNARSALSPADMDAEIQHMMAGWPVE